MAAPARYGSPGQPAPARRRGQNQAAPGTVGALYTAPQTKWGTSGPMGTRGFAPPPELANVSQQAAWVPEGLNAGMFSLSTPEQVDPMSGQQARRFMLDRAAPKLQKAIASRNIFAYNAALSQLRSDIARTAYGDQVPKETPDKMELRRKARMKQQRLPMGSREQTMFGMI